MTGAIALSLLTAFLWGLAPVFYKQFYKRCSSYMSYIIDACFGSLLILLPFALLGSPEYSRLGSAILLTAPYSLSYLFFLMAFEYGKVSLVSVVTQTYPIFTLGLAITLGSESLAVTDIGLILLLVFSTMFIGLLVKEQKEQQADAYTWFILSLLAAFFLGFGNFFLDESVSSYNLYTTTLAIFLSQLLMGAVLLIILRKQMLTDFKILRTHPVLVRSALWGSIAMSVGAVSLYKAFELGSASLVSTVSSLEPIFTLVFAALLLRERLSTVQWLLIGVAFTALFFLAY